ncbi:MAG: type IV toxin-antitoxin system AbiEi family antitoxin domain-containing protein [Bacilli bacterium]|nr:type IV toxin-antitoxin system AbiEi family antitoxin domain-containing protein [Bacilli bacterium]
MKSIIVDILNSNQGYITTKEITNKGIHRMYLKKMCDDGIIEKVGTGIYIDKSIIPDYYYIMRLELPNVVFSHMTALYFHNLSIKAPNDSFDITVPNNYFNYKLKNHNVFYCDKESYEIGLTYVRTPMGNLVKAYDMERCICDIIKSKNRIDFELIKYSIKTYLKRKDKDLTKLSIYARKLGIEKEVANYLEFFYE